MGCMSTQPVRVKTRVAQAEDTHVIDVHVVGGRNVVAGMVESGVCKAGLNAFPGDPLIFVVGVEDQSVIAPHLEVLARGQRDGAAVGTADFHRKELAGPCSEERTSRIG